MNSNFLSAFKELDLNEGPKSENRMKIKKEKHSHLDYEFYINDIN